jgi:hypothetical protein
MQLIEALVLRSAEPNAARWFEDHIATKGVSTTRFRAAFAGAGRRLGGSAPQLQAAEAAQLQQAGVAAPAQWTLPMFARAAFLLRTIHELPPGEHVEFVREVYRRGDFLEQAALLQALMLVANPARFVNIAVESCRTNVRDVFEAIACENCYPAAHFPDANFNQLVIKAFFTGVAVDRIVGLDQRKSDELRRMAADYASERRAAGRAVPNDLDLVLS